MPATAFIESADFEDFNFIKAKRLKAENKNIKNPQITQICADLAIGYKEKGHGTDLFSNYRITDCNPAAFGSGNEATRAEKARKTVRFGSRCFVRPATAGRLQSSGCGLIHQKQTSIERYVIDCNYIEESMIRRQ